jgi:hypothetical protein
MAELLWNSPSLICLAVEEDLTLEKFCCRFFVIILEGLIIGIFLFFILLDISGSGESMPDFIGMNFIDDIVNEWAQNSAEYERRG